MFKLITASMAIITADAIAVKTDFRPPQGSTPWHKAAKGPDEEEKDYPRNYVVPHFGEDRDITDSKRHMT